MIELHIRADINTGKIELNLPNNLIVALGMLEAAKEAVLMNQVRPTFAPKVVPGVVMPGNNLKSN